MKRIMTVYGTRPEAIKVAPIIRALECSENFKSIPVVTGQHREMLDQVNEVFGIEPEADLKIMKRGQGLNGILSKVIEGVDQVIDSHYPDALIVQGDTSTAMGAALAAFNRGIPVVHVEAGLRSGDMTSPFPEEANRRLVSQVASLHLAPTKRAQKNLLKEGFKRKSIIITGNTVIDALMSSLNNDAPFADYRIREVVDSGRKVVLVTTHRRENLGKKTRNIGMAVAELSQKYPDLLFVLPLHMNPLVRETLQPYLKAENIIATDPIAYGDFTRLMRRTFLVLTDSGGIQEEAPALNIPVLVMRSNTERQEGIKAGTLKLVGTKTSKIVRSVTNLIEDENAYQQMAQAENPYGDGNAAARIVAELENLLL
ncbi:non-hydrolyzing UDP-N-acetylglucosamine 2-epimerase [Rothia aerolata]|nr:UDP-N-acetylglucosamine 2-epimerase (non-hydrolyzing) [Rothia aerolata]